MRPLQGREDTGVNGFRRFQRLSNKATGLVRRDKIYAQTSIHRAGTGTCPYRLCPDPMTDIGYHNEKDLLDSL